VGSTKTAAKSGGEGKDDKDIEGLKEHEKTAPNAHKEEITDLP